MQSDGVKEFLQAQLFSFSVCDHAHSRPHGARDIFLLSVEEEIRELPMPDSQQKSHEKALKTALFITFGFFGVEIAAGLIAGSLSLLSDAVHMAADSTSLLIAIIAVKMCQRAPDRRRTYGYFRFEPIAAGINALVLLSVAAYIFVESIHRFSEPKDVAAPFMLATAFGGLVVNFLCMRILGPATSGSLNLKSAYLEVWADFISSVGIIAGGALIYFFGWRWVDPLIALLISLWMLPRIWGILHESGNVLLEGTPHGIDSRAVGEMLAALPGVEEVHDLHIWAIGTGRLSLTAHVIVDSFHVSPQAVLNDIKSTLAERFNIHHSTIQVETNEPRIRSELHYNETTISAAYA